MTTREEAARLADALLEAVVLDKHMMQAAALLRQWPDAAAQEPVAWREHVEQRIRTWRQSTMNRSGDRLAIDDFMGQDSIDDLVDFVCDVYAAPPAAPAPVVREPIIDEMDAVASKYAHKMALDLECVLSDYSGKWWDAAMQTLGEYREAMNRIHERESPTHMGEPLIVKRGER